MLIRNNKIIKIILVVICFLTLFPLITKAETEVGSTAPEYKLLEPLPLGTGVTDTPGLGPYLVGMFTLIIGVAGVLAVVMITIGGVQYMTTEAISGKGEAKNKITRAVFGLVLALSSWLLLSEIDPTLITTSMTLEAVPAPPGTEYPPGTEAWLGMCANGQSCGGTDQSSCQTDCNTVCPGEISMSVSCQTNSYGYYIGRCNRSKAIGGSVVCGGENAPDAATCNAACEASCHHFPQILVNCSKQTTD